MRDLRSTYAFFRHTPRPTSEHGFFKSFQRNFTERLIKTFWKHSTFVQLELPSESGKYVRHCSWRVFPACAYYKIAMFTTHERIVVRTTSQKISQNFEGNSHTNLKITLFDTVIIFFLVLVVTFFMYVSWWISNRSNVLSTSFTNSNVV